MTQWNPIWLVEIDGTSYTTAILANLRVTSGRRNIYEQANAGYVNLELLDVNQTAIPVNINSTIGVSIKNTSGTFVPIFGGNVVDIGLEVRDIGNTMFTQTYSITALGALARLPKALTRCFARDEDGDQIYEFYKPFYLAMGVSTRGIDLGNVQPNNNMGKCSKHGLGEIDRPGNYELQLDRVRAHH
jgi:hypothetical protein